VCPVADVITASFTAFISHSLTCFAVMIIAAACVACLLNVNAVLVSVIAGSLTRSAVIVDVIAGNLTRSAVLVAVIAGSLTWSALEIEPAIAARTGHTAVCCPCQFKSHDYNNVLVFGGGDN